MNQKEYELIASILVGEFYTGDDLNDPDTVLAEFKDYDTFVGLVETFANEFKRNYPKTFDEAKFRKACGL